MTMKFSDETIDRVVGEIEAAEVEEERVAAAAVLSTLEASLPTEDGQVFRFQLPSRDRSEPLWYVAIVSGGRLFMTGMVFAHRFPAGASRPRFAAHLMRLGVDSVERI